jgi:DNA-directed RNA polymerase subunit H (RpoH/RPB5)
MEDKAVEILKLMLTRRGLDVSKTERITTDELERVNLMSIGDVLVVFSQKDKGILDRDVRNFVKFAGDNGYTHGVILVGVAKPSQNVLKVIKSFSKERVQFFHIWQLQFDIMSHRLMMPHRILKEDERTKLFNQHKITNPMEQLPWIDSQDPPAKWIGAIPGDIIEVARHSDVVGTAFHWRICVEDVNVV